MSTPIKPPPASEKAESAESFFGKQEAPKGSPSDLFNKFKGSDNITGAPAPTPDGTKPPEAQVPTAEDRPPSQVVDIPEAKAPEVKKDGGFIKDLKSKNAELEAEIARYKDQELPARQKEIDELKAQIADGGTKATLDQLRNELKALQDQKSERENELITQVEETKKKLSFYDIQQDPAFIEKYVAPISNSYGHLQVVLGNDQGKMAELNKAIAAHRASLTLKDPAQAQQQYNQAQEIATGIFEQLSGIQQTQFGNAFFQIMTQAAEYQKALDNHEVVKRDLLAEQQRITQNEAYKAKQRWQNALKENGEKIEKDTQYSEEIARVIAAQKIDDSTSIDDQIISAIPEDGAASFPPEDIARVLQQGRGYKKLKAQTAALLHLLKEKDETIAKLRGSSTGSDQPSGSFVPQRQTTEEKTPAGLFAKFAESRK